MHFGLHNSGSHPKIVDHLYFLASRILMQQTVSDNDQTIQLALSNARKL